MIDDSLVGQLTTPEVNTRDTLELAHLKAIFLCSLDIQLYLAIYSYDNPG